MVTVREFSQSGVHLYAAIGTPKQLGVWPSQREIGRALILEQGQIKFSIFQSSLMEETMGSIRQTTATCLVGVVIFIQFPLEVDCMLLGDRR